MSFRDLPGRAVRGAAFGAVAKELLIDTFTVHDAKAGKTAAVVLDDRQPLPSTAPTGALAAELVTLPLRRTPESDAARLLSSTVRARTDRELPVIRLRDIHAEAYRALDLVHVGVNDLVRELLRPIWPAVRDELRGRAMQPVGEFAPEYAPDGDGYLIVALRDLRGARHHLVVLGGVGFGTYFGVAAMLARHAGARWLWPGPAGTVIPRDPTLVLSGVEGDSALNLYEEPDYRGRGLDVLASTTQSLAAIDATRTWALNNRCHPSDPRIYLWQKVTAQREREETQRTGRVAPGLNCRAQLDWSELVIVRKEARIPVPHALHDMLSPFDLNSDDRRLGDAHPEFYPDVRPRVSLDGDRLVPGASDPSPLGLAARLGRPVRPAHLQAASGPFEAVANCDDPYEPWTPTERASRLVSLRVTNESSPRIGPEDFTKLTLTQLGPGYYAPDRLDPGLKSFTAIVERPGRDLYRFIPYALRSSFQQAHQPAPAGWKPCVYDQDAEPRGRVGRLAPVRRALVDRLLTECVGEISAWGSQASREAVVSLLPNDGGGWCQCDACILSSTSNGDGIGGRLNGGTGQPASWRMYKGVTLFPIEQTRPDLPRTVDIAGLGRVPNFGYYDRDGGVAEVYTVPEALRDEFATPTLTQDQLAALGFLTNGRQNDDHTRRHVDLVRSVVEAVNATGPFGLTEVWFTTAAYSTWRAAPMFSGSSSHLFEGPRADFGSELTAPSGDAQETALPANVIMFVTGVRDLTEYDPSLPWYRGSSSIRFWSRASEQFNVMRWSAIARVQGVYEYMLDGWSFACARLYSRRLHAALWRAWRERGRAFVAEAAPSWAVEGPKWYELSGLLWSLGDLDEWRAATARPVALRLEYCRALATPTEGMVSAAPDTALVTELVSFFDEVERRWSETVDQALLGYQGSWELGLTNLQGKIAQFEQVDPLIGATFDAPNPLVARMEALASRSSSPSVRARLGFLLKGWRLFEHFARISREVRYLRRYIAERSYVTTSGERATRHEFVRTWGAPSTVPVPMEALLSQALTRLSGWLADPMVFRTQVREALNQRLADIGAVRITGASLELPGSGNDALTDDQFVLNHRDLSAYVNAWNGRTQSFSGLDANSGLFGALVGDLKQSVANIAEAVRSFSGGSALSELAAVGRFSQEDAYANERFALAFIATA